MTLDWKHNAAHWSLLQQIVTRDPVTSAQILQLDPNTAEPTDAKSEAETYEPALPKSAPLSDQLIAAGERVGHFHRDCLLWLSKRSPMTPRIFLESGSLWAVGLAVARRCGLRLGFGEVFPNLYYLWGRAHHLLPQKHRVERDLQETADRVSLCLCINHI